MNPPAPRKPISTWRVPLALIGFSLIPSLAGTARLIGMATAAQPTPDGERFFADPVPAVLHIVAACVWCLLGAFQFSQGVRRRSPSWHRRAGRVLVPTGFVAALTGLWMTWFYPVAGFDGPAVFYLRLAAGVGMAGAIVLGFVAIRRRDIAAHRAWMIRGYALGLGVGTQVLTHIPFFLFETIQGELSRAVAMGAGWVINAAVAEWIIRRSPRAHSPAGAVGQWTGGGASSSRPRARVA